MSVEIGASREEIEIEIDRGSIAATFIKIAA